MKPIIVFTALGLLTGSAVLPARAQNPSDAANTSTTISLAGEVVMRIRTGAGGYTAAQRADAVRTRLTPILSLPGLTAHDVTVQTLTEPVQHPRARPSAADRGPDTGAGQRPEAGSIGAGVGGQFARGHPAGDGRTRTAVPAGEFIGGATRRLAPTE